MPYIVQAGGPDDRSVSKEFLPPISTQFKARLSSPRALAPEERALLPRTLLVGPPERGGLPGVLGWSTGAFIVSEAVRDIIEELEPGVQEFVPLEVRSKDDVAIAGNTNHGTYYLILSPPST